MICCGICCGRGEGCLDERSYMYSGGEMMGDVRSFFQYDWNTCQPTKGLHKKICASVFSQTKTVSSFLLFAVSEGSIWSQRRGIILGSLECINCDYIRWDMYRWRGDRRWRGVWAWQMEENSCRFVHLMQVVVLKSAIGIILGVGCLRWLSTWGREGFRS